METPKLFREQCPAGLWPRLPCSHQAARPSSETYAQSAPSGAVSAAPWWGLGWEELTLDEGSSPSGRLAAGWWEGLATWPGQKRIGEVSPGLAWEQALHQPGALGWGSPGAGEDGVTMVLCFQQALAGVHKEGSVRRTGTQGLRRAQG